MASVSNFNNNAAPLTTLNPQHAVSPNPRLQSDSQIEKKPSSQHHTHTRDSFMKNAI